MRPKGDDTAQAIIGWFSDEIKNSSGTISDLGKFFFGASSGAIGLLITLATVGEKLALAPSLCLSLTFFSVSLFISINMVTPRVWLVTGETDLIQEYKATVERGKNCIRYWFLFWIFGSVVAVTYLLSKSH